MNHINPKEESHRNRIYKRRNKSLESEVESLKREVEHHKEQVIKLLNDSVPELVKNWMREYSLPWEMFWCYEHSKWLLELDSLFPYSIESSHCESCQQPVRKKGKITNRICPLHGLTPN